MTASVAIAEKTQEFAINASNYRHWSKPVRAYIDDCIAGSEGPRAKNFNMRWIASLVAETHRILMRGGLFLYPSDARPGYEAGRLRMVYECAPIALLIAITPGPNNFCAMNNGIRHGVTTAVVATTGRVIAFAFFLLISAVGLGAMLMASEQLFTAIKWIGAAYLLYLGVSAWRSRAFALDEQQGLTQPRRTLWLATRQEFLIGISNPKAILLFAAIFPQFIRPDQPAAEQFLYLGTTYLLAEYAASLKPICGAIAG